MLGVDSEELAEADFSAGCIAKNETELPNEELDLFARALNQLGWCLMRSGVALESRRRCRLTEGCFAHAVRIAKKIRFTLRGFRLEWLRDVLPELRATRRAGKK